MGVQGRYKGLLAETPGGEKEGSECNTMDEASSGGRCPAGPDAEPQTWRKWQRLTGAYSRLHNHWGDSSDPTLRDKEGH